MLVSQIFLPALAQKPVFPELPKGSTLGMEIELTPERSRNLMEFFDFSHLQNSINYETSEFEQLLRELPEDFFDDYVENGRRKVFTTLPEEMQKKYEHLKPVVISSDAHKLSVPKKEALGANLTTPKLSIPRPALSPQIPNTSLAGSVGEPAKIPDHFQQRGGLVVPNTAAWDELITDWKKLGKREQAEHVSWELLSDQKKAQLVHAFAELKNPLSRLEGHGLILKKGIPQDVHDLLSRLSWHIDEDALEFTHNPGVSLGLPSTLGQLHRDILQLGKLAGVDRTLQNFQKGKIDGVSLHYTIRVPGSMPERYFSELNELLMLRRISAGIVSDLSGGKYVFTDDQRQRGLMSIRSEIGDAVEFRAHVGELEEHLRLNGEILRLKPEEAMKRIEAEIASILQNAGTVDLILKYNPRMLLRFAKHLSKDTLPRVQAEIAQFDQNIAKRLLNEDILVVKATLNAMRDIPVWDDAVWKTLSELLRKNPSFILAFKNTLKTQSKWPPEIWTQVYSILNSPTSDRIKMLQFISHRADFPDKVWDYLIRNFHSLPKNVQEEFFMGFWENPTWPEKFWRFALMEIDQHRTKLSGRFEDVLEIVLKANPQIKIPSKVEAEYRGLIQSLRPPIPRDCGFSNIGKRPPTRR